MDSMGMTYSWCHSTSMLSSGLIANMGGENGGMGGPGPSGQGGGLGGGLGGLLGRGGGGLSGIGGGGGGGGPNAMCSSSIHGGDSACGFSLASNTAPPPSSTARLTCAAAA